jgi:ribonuclease P protein component
LFSYLKENRLRTQKDFDFKGCSRVVARTAFFTILCRKKKIAPIRIGVVLSRKVGNSVVRHRFKRVVVESFRTHSTQEEKSTGSVDYLVVFNGQYFKKNKMVLDFKMLEQELKTTLTSLFKIPSL